MDLKQFDLDGLSTIWQVSEGNLGLRGGVEIELKLRIAENKNFSREFVFQVCRIFNHALTVSFIPSSDAYKAYGESVTIDILLDDAEMEELLLNYTSKPPIQTHGTLRAKSIVHGQLKDGQKKHLETVGFNTSDILSTLSI